MIIKITDSDGKEKQIKNIKKTVLTQTAGVACDSLLVEFASKQQPNDAEKICAYDNDGNIIFNGFCDCIKISIGDDGYNAFIYARSSACLLVDSQALPYTYNKPTALQLYITYAKPLGFKYRLDDIKSASKYEVSYGTSRFAAVNNLVSMVAGEEIYINPQNEICLLEKSGDIKSIDGGKVLSATQTLNRSEGFSDIHYKKEYSTVYDCHMHSSYAQSKNISREKYVNLTSLAPWQRSYKISKLLKNSFDNFSILELCLSGHVYEPLYQRFCYSGALGDFNDYILYESVYTSDSGGDKTILRLKENIDIGEINYVDK